MLSPWKDMFRSLNCHSSSWDSIPLLCLPKLTIPDFDHVAYPSTAGTTPCTFYSKSSTMLLGFSQVSGLCSFINTLIFSGKSSTSCSLIVLSTAFSAGCVAILHPPHCYVLEMCYQLQRCFILLRAWMQSLAISLLTYIITQEYCFLHHLIVLWIFITRSSISLLCLTSEF